jgi:hypothetical protein
VLSSPESIRSASRNSAMSDANCAESAEPGSRMFLLSATKSRREARFILLHAFWSTIPLRRHSPAWDVMRPTSSVVKEPTVISPHLLFSRACGAAVLELTLTPG